MNLQNHDISDIYRFQEELGSGSYATVYRAIKKGSNEVVAIKKMKPNLQEGMKVNIKREIDIMRSIKNPNVVELIDHKLCSLGDLSDYIKQTKKSPERSNVFGGLNETYFRHFLKQLASAFKAFRAKGLVHRDLKPQNILLTHSETGYYNSSTRSNSNLPTLKVADFGFAKILPVESMTATYCGSPIYMAPEVLNNLRYDATSDLWSIGAVLFEMITGGVPYPSPNTAKLIQNIRNANDTFLFPDEISEDTDSKTRNNSSKSVEISSDIKSLIRSLLKQRPSDRISFQDFFNHPTVVGDRSRNAKEHSNSGNRFATVRKAPSLSTLRTNSTETESELQRRRVSMHNRSQSNDITLTTAGSNNPDESDQLEQEYVIIPSYEMGKQRQYSNHVKTYSAPPGIDFKKGRLDGIDIPNPDRKPELFIENNGNYDTNSPPRNAFQDESKVEDDQSGWEIGNDATSILSQAIDKATSMLTNLRGLSPPAIPVDVSTKNASFPLEGEFASPEEKEFLKDVEEVACQAYVVSKLADLRFKKTPYFPPNTTVFNPELHKTSYELTSSESTSLQEALLLYTKAASLLKLGSDQICSYVSKSPNIHHSVRMIRSTQWLLNKFSECHQKSYFIKDRLRTTKLELNSSDIDILIFNYVLDTSRKFALDELTQSVVINHEVYETCIWLIKSLDHRFHNELALNNIVRDRKPTLLASLEYMLAAHNEKMSHTTDVYQ